MSKITQLHHLTPTSRWGSDSQVNKIIREAQKHLIHHLEFKNKTPVGQLKHVLEKNIQVYTEDFIRDFYNLLKDHEERYYKEWVLRKPKWWWLEWVCGDEQTEKEDWTQLYIPDFWEPSEVLKNMKKWIQKRLSR